MKTRFICFKINPVVCFGVIATLIILLGLIIVKADNIKETEKAIQTVAQQEKIENCQKGPPLLAKNIQAKNRIMPEEVNSYEILGKIKIPKIELETYILSETNTKSLNVSVTKLCGPDINEIGNFCITGHNYNNNKMFGKIKKLEKGDTIILTNPFGESITYNVYEKFETNPQNTSCLSQETNYDREITLITSTMGAINRVIIKAVEFYD